MEVDIDRVAVQCRTEEDVNLLFEFLDGIGYKWAGGDSLLRYTNYFIRGVVYFIYGDWDGRVVRYGDLQHAIKDRPDFRIFYSVDDFLAEYGYQPMSLDIGDVL